MLDLVTTSQFRNPPHPHSCAHWYTFRFVLTAITAVFFGVIGHLSL